MHYPEAYVQYLVQFHGHRDFFECHEILEEHWKEKPSGYRDKHWVGLIQIAVGLYHHRRANWRGAQKTFRNARRIVQEYSASLEELALDTDQLLFLMDQRLSDILLQRTYTDMNLPITDTSLTDQCFRMCEKENVDWLGESDMFNDHLVHRHILRDRTDITEERIQQKWLREQKKLSRT
ncbi:hypothetical protein SAMN05192534_101610 [Alteribacillus persepolensis]|uniref:DUF309 domain-containing protein n=1 Tax=Alteribacillus persepolensis TaxID=568899 RepID=A0A1G7ZMK5_9BACI|nr:DUF309 domain-containing protein [Alteribacillus persepolensis]SDH09933.1 hypothetical protein SAMN05192534_101610 [Alteribacillus persepolensis]